MILAEHRIRLSDDGEGLRLCARRVAGAPDREGHGGDLLQPRSRAKRFDIRPFGRTAREADRLLRYRSEAARRPLPPCERPRFRKDEGTACDRGARKLGLLRRADRDLAEDARRSRRKSRPAPDLLLRPLPWHERRSYCRYSS